MSQARILLVIGCFAAGVLNSQTPPKASARGMYFGGFDEAPPSPAAVSAAPGEAAKPEPPKPAAQPRATKKPVTPVRRVDPGTPSVARGNSTTTSVPVRAVSRKTGLT